MLYFPSNKAENMIIIPTSSVKATLISSLGAAFACQGKEGNGIFSTLGETNRQEKNCIICLFIRLSFKLFSFLPSFATCFKLPPNVQSRARSCLCCSAPAQLLLGSPGSAPCSQQAGGLRLSSQDYTHTLMQMPQPFPKSHLTCLAFLLHRDARELTCTVNTRPQTATANRYFSGQLKMHGVQLNETTLPHIQAATDTCFGPRQERGQAAAPPRAALTALLDTGQRAALG